MSDIEIDANKFAAACSCVSTEWTRPYLNGVSVTPAPDPETGRGVLLVATDGHRMALIWDADGHTDTPRILQLDAKSKALKPARGEGRRVLHINAIERGRGAIGRLALGYTADDRDALDFVDEISVHEIDGRFPDWMRVMPAQPKDGVAVYQGNSFNPAYIADIAAAVKRLDGSRTGVFSIAQAKPGGPAWCWSTGAPYARFVLMPMRVDSGPGRPAWLSYHAAPRPKRKAAE